MPPNSCAQIEAWPFCTAADNSEQSACQGAVGEFVDLGIAIKGSLAPNITAGGSGNGSDAQGAAGAPYPLGGGAELVLSTRVQVDGTWTNMSAGYPSVSTDGEQYLIAFRFPKHSISVLYDPVVRAAQTSTSSKTSTGGETGSASANGGASDGSVSGGINGIPPSAAGTNQAMSTGALAGVVVGAVIALALLMIAAVAIARARARKARKPNVKPFEHAAPVSPQPASSTQQ